MLKKLGKKKDSKRLVNGFHRKGKGTILSKEAEGGRELSARWLINEGQEIKKTRQTGECWGGRVHKFKNKAEAAGTTDRVHNKAQGNGIRT